LFKKIIFISLSILFYSLQGQAQFKCYSGSGQCADKNDYVCNLSQTIWSEIKTLEDVWATSLIPRFEDKNTVSYTGYNKYCRHRGYRGDKFAQVHVQVTEDTTDLKKYNVIHSACGKDGVLTENWEIQGKNLKPLDLRSIIFDLNRKFDLGENETYKSFSLVNDGSEFKPQTTSPLENFNSFRAQSIFKFTAQRYESFTKNQTKTEKVHTYFWLFNKRVFSQIIDKTLNTSNFNFYSPTYPFTLRFNRFASKCHKAEVGISFDELLLIKSSKDNRKYGLDYKEFINDCINQETTNYVESAKKIVVSHLTGKFPIFTNNASVNRNAVLQKDVEAILRYIQGGNRDLSILFTQKLLEDVKSNRVLDNR